MQSACERFEVDFAGAGSLDALARAHERLLDQLTRGLFLADAPVRASLARLLDTAAAAAGGQTAEVERQFDEALRDCLAALQPGAHVSWETDDDLRDGLHGQLLLI